MLQQSRMMISSSESSLAINAEFVTEEFTSRYEMFQGSSILPLASYLVSLLTLIDIHACRVLLA